MPAVHGSGRSSLENSDQRSNTGCRTGCDGASSSPDQTRPHYCRRPLAVAYEDAMRRSATSLPALRGNHRLRSTTEVALEGDGKVRFNTDLLSAILNLICPECGAAMGGRSKEF